MTEDLVMKPEKFLETLEKAYSKDIRTGVEIHLRVTGQELLGAYPVTNAEHNFFHFDGDPKAYAKSISQSIVDGHALELKDKDGNKRTISYAALRGELIEFWKKRLNKD